ncbi:hypothetical protein BKH45_05360 [Helicobacter sp. 11S03491-1]|nr:hypothetical protein BKH45_05360 [Helicobacter sp. 11S03491-1]
MIRELIIKNSVAFENLDLEFHNGFNVFSGASGSGKSVLMESLLGIFGLKDTNAEFIEADLDVCLNDFGVILDEFGLSQEDEGLTISIIKKEKTRYFINHYGSSKRRLSELMSKFGKHISSKGADELKVENILRVFDDFIIDKNPSHKELLENLRKEFHLYNQLREDLRVLEEEERNIQNLKEFAEFEIQKISSIAPKEGEYEKLLELKKSLSKKEKIQESLQDTLYVLEEASKITHTLALIGKQSALFEEGLLEVRAFLDDESQRLETLDEINTEEMLNRIELLADLNRRYGSITQALHHLEVQNKKLQDYQNLTQDKASLTKKIDNSRNICFELGKHIRINRQKFLIDFEKEILCLCKQLLLKDPKITLKPCDLKKTGFDEIEFKLENTTIESLSSGEYNRMRLAMMCLDAKINHSGGILVLDEIDANLSGQESEGVAKVLQMLSKTYQVFAISHQPHMPVLADWHYLVYKEKGKSQLKLLDKQGRIEEMARMISGVNITNEALEFAKKRLEEHS